MECERKGRKANNVEFKNKGKYGVGGTREDQTGTRPLLAMVRNLDFILGMMVQKGH